MSDKMKRTLHILRYAWKGIKWVLVVVYVVVALANYSLVQSLLGAKVGQAMSQQWGGKVKVGSIGMNLWDHVVLRDVLLISPEGDTIANAGRIGLRFDGNPVVENGLRFRTVSVKDTYFHLAIDTNGINLKYIINHYPPKPGPKEKKPFTLNVGLVMLQNVHYKQDLLDAAARGLHGADSLAKITPAERLGVGVVIPHMEYSGLNARFQSLVVDHEGHVTCRIQELQCHERSGLNVHHLEGDVDVGPKGIVANNFVITTDSSHLEADVRLKCTTWKTMKYYCDSVEMHVLFKPGTDLSMATAAYWAPVLWGMDTRARITGVVHGPVANLHCSNMDVRFGRSTHLHFDGSVVGLPFIQHTDFNVYVERLCTTYDDLCAVHHPSNRKPVKVLPLLKPMGTIDLVATFQGKINDFRATAHVNSAVGSLLADATMTAPRIGAPYAYSARVSSPSLSITPIAKNEWVSATGFDLTVQGHDFAPQRMQASLDGRLHHTHLKGTPLRESTLNAHIAHGHADLQLNIADTLLRLALGAEAEIASRQPSCLVEAQLAHADLKALHLWGNAADSAVALHSSLKAQARMNLDDDHPIESLEAMLRMEGTTLSRNGHRFALDSLTLQASQQNHRKRIALRSDVADADLRGYFDYTDIPLLARRFCDRYMPLYYNPYARKDSADYAPIADANLALGLAWKEGGDKLHALLPSLTVARGSRVTCDYNFGESFKLVVKSDSLRLGSLALHDLYLRGNDEGGGFRIAGRTDGLLVGSTALLDGLELNLTAAPTTSFCQLDWGTSTIDSTFGNISLVLQSDLEGNRLKVARDHILVHGARWHLSTANDILLARQCIRTQNLQLRSHNQSLSLDMSICQQPDDSIQARFSDFDLKQVNFLLAPSGFALEGNANGYFRIFSLSESPLVNGNVSIADFVLNDQFLGDATLTAQWSPDDRHLNLDMSSLRTTEAGRHQPIAAKGYFDMATATPAMHFDVALSRFDLQALAPVVSGFSSQVEGLLDARLSVDGTLKEPQVEGGLRVSQGLLMVDALNMTFAIDDSLTLMPDCVVLDSFTIRDPLGNPLALNGRVRHQGFSHLDIDLSLHTDRLWLMNTGATRSSSFYGSLYASANGRITGSEQRIDIAVDAVTREGSHIWFPISNRLQVKEKGYIRFDEEEALTAVADQPLPQEAEERNGTLGYHIAVNLSVTPDAAVGLPVDFSPIRADVSTTGQGDLRLTLDPSTDLSLLGTYEISAGNLKLTLAGLATRDFELDEGSSIDFRGAISNANFNISAAYGLRVNLATLTGVSASTERSQNIQVQDVLKIAGTLNSPTIGFDIRLPNADQSVEEEVFSFIDRSNERDMLNQCVSLLVSGNFYNSTTSNTTSVENSGYAMLANTLGSVVSGMVSVVDINFDYTAASELTRQQFDVDINKDFGKVYFESTLGIGEANNLTGDATTNQITGDVLLGYKFRPNVHFFVFNRSNTNDFTRYDMPYKQGLGIKLTKDFDTLGELFGIKPKERRKE